MKKKTADTLAAEHQGQLKRPYDTVKLVLRCVEVFAVVAVLPALVYQNVITNRQLDSIRKETTAQRILLIEDSERFINTLLIENESFARVFFNIPLDPHMEFEAPEPGASAQSKSPKPASLSNGIDDGKLGPSQPNNLHNAKVGTGQNAKNELDHVGKLHKMRSSILSFVFLQEWEKMYRTCAENLVSIEFWDSILELMIFTVARTPFISETFNHPDSLKGFHPDFQSFMRSVLDSVKSFDIASASQQQTNLLISSLIPALNKDPRLANGCARENL